MLPNFFNRDMDDDQTPIRPRSERGSKGPTDVSWIKHTHFLAYENNNICEERWQIGVIIKDKQIGTSGGT